MKNIISFLLIALCFNSLFARNTDVVSKGNLDVICGSMYSGKSEAIIQKLRRLQIAKTHVVIFKHSFDNRTSVEFIDSHNGTQIKAYPVENVQEIIEHLSPETEAIGIDEVQFFDESIVPLILELIDNGVDVIVAGLDLDFRGLPFSTMSPLLAVADHVIKLKAICTNCGKDAHYSQRLVNGSPAKFDDPIIMIGAEECYQARCRECFKIDIMPKRSLKKFK